MLGWFSAGFLQGLLGDNDCTARDERGTFIHEAQIWEELQRRQNMI
jgi:hypothetical protein